MNRILLRKNTSAMPVKLQTADLAMDLLTHEVTRDGKEIIVTSKEFSLLEYLLRNAGHIVTRTAISEHVWDINFDTATNVIDVHMAALRKKIDRTHREKLIHTVRGRGYIIKG